MTTHTHPAGTTVRYDGAAEPHIGKMFTVLDPDAPENGDAVNDRRRSTREFVEDSRGLHWWLEADMLTPIPTPTRTDKYPVGCTVRDVKYNVVGTVVGHRAATGGPVVEFTGDDGKTYRAGFPDPEGRLERIHILTHEELTLLDGTVRRHGESVQAQQTLDRHLRPTRTATFMVTVEQPSSDNPVDAATLELVLHSDDSLSYPVTIIEAVTTTKEN